MTMVEHHILPGGTMMILMSIFGKLLKNWLRSFPSVTANQVFLLGHFIALKNLAGPGRKLHFF